MATPLRISCNSGKVIWAGRGLVFVLLCGLAFSTLGKDRLVTPMGKALCGRMVVARLWACLHFYSGVYSMRVM